MNTYAEILRAVSACHECELRQSFIKNYRGSINYHSFCLYSSHRDAEKSKYVMVMQNPGLPRKWRDSDEYVELPKAEENDFISIMQKHLIRWFKRNKSFSWKFFPTLKEYGLIRFDSVEEYLDEQFLSDFLVTDLVKCRAETGSIENAHIATCAELYLHRELQSYGRGKLIFAFSSRTWEFLCSRYLHGLPNGKQKVAKAHGELFRSDELNAYFIPLAHFSQRQFNNYLRDSYFAYLRDGLKEYAAKQNSTTQ